MKDKTVWPWQKVAGVICWKGYEISLQGSWLYRSKTYMAFSIAIPIVALIVGLNFAPFVLAAVMIAFEVFFSIL